MPNIRTRTDQAADSAHETLDTLHDGVEQARTAIPEAFNRAAAQVQELTRRGLDRARAVGDGVKEKALTAQDTTAGYIKDEPLKSVLIAAGVGAAVALVLNWLSSSRRI